MKWKVPYSIEDFVYCAKGHAGDVGDDETNRFKNPPPGRPRTRDGDFINLFLLAHAWCKEAVRERVASC